MNCTRSSVNSILSPRTLHHRHRLPLLSRWLLSLIMGIVTLNLILCSHHTRFQPGFYTHGGQPSYSQQPKSEQLDLLSMLSARNTSPSAPSVAGSSAAPISNITNLYNALLKAGVVSASGIPTGAGEMAKPEESKPKPVDAAKARARANLHTLSSLRANN